MLIHQLNSEGAAADKVPIVTGIGADEPRLPRLLSVPVLYLHTARGKAITWNKEQGKGACGICDSF